MGTKEGGLAAAETNKERHGKDFYKLIGQMGGKKSKSGGFASDFVGEDGLTGRERARTAGAKGGRVGKRKPQSYYEKESTYAKLKGKK